MPIPNIEDVVVAAIFADLRDRKLLKFLFDPEPENCGTYGCVEGPLDREVQEEIAETWRNIVRAHLTKEKNDGK